ncbi:MAG: Slp family lipoprotein [Nitrospirae bacterium]|nr:Slp family lipoprotein [Nitrospirota bacterium]
MKYIFEAVLFFLAGIAISACASYKVFPPKVLDGVDPNFDFTRWRMMPNQAEAKKIQLGGRIVQSEVKGETVTIVVAHLPVVEHPAYGPKETGRHNGEFAITYQGTIEPTYVQPGNRVMVVGTTRPPKVVMVDDLARSLPTVAAQCVHFWNTGGREIADFPYYDGGYTTLEEQTVCANNP